MIVVDSSAAISALLHDGPAREALGREQIHAPHLIDVEVASVLRRGALNGSWTAARGSRSLTTWGQLGVIRYGTHTLLRRIWQLRDNLSAYDAAYVGLAEALNCALVTADRRLAQSSGPRCPITVVPR
jgi:predicted nucleic acid-binding protein